MPNKCLEQEQHNLLEQSDDTIKCDQHLVVSPEFSELLNLFETHHISKICQKITLASLNQHSEYQRKSLLKTIILNFSKYIEIYCEIQTLNKLRLDSLSKLASLSKNDKKLNKQFISNAYDQIEHLRATNLDYTQTLFRLFKLLCNNNPKVYEMILKKNSRIFIKLYSNLLTSNILPFLIKLSQSFDPMLIELKGKNQYLNFKIQRKLIQDPQFHDRLSLAHRQITKAINLEQIKFLSENKNLDSQIYTEPILKYNNDLAEVKTKSIFDSPNTMEFKSSIRFKIRQSRILTQPNDSKQLGENSADKIVQNFRKKSLQSRMMTSVSQKSDGSETLQRATISTQKYHEIHRKSSQKNQRYMNAPKKLNFRAINLEPLQNPSFVSSISSGNLYPAEVSLSKKDQSENKFIFNLKRKSKKQASYFSRTQKSVQEDVSDFDSPQKTEKSLKKYIPPSSNKLMSILSKQRSRKFESDQDLTSGFSDDSSVQKYGRSDSTIIRKRNQSKKKNNPIIDESIMLQYRNQKINEVEEDSSMLVSRKEVFNILDSQKEFSKLKPKTKTKEEEETLGSTTNIESKGQQISEYSCNQRSNTKGQNIDQKSSNKQQKTYLLQQNDLKSIPGVSGILPQQIIPEKQTSSSQNNSFKRVQEPKQEDNKIKRKIILKASKVGFQEVPNYFEKLGFFRFNSIVKDIAAHQHYICEFYLNETIFNVILFCPSFDFQSVEVKLIHEIQDVDSGIFESISVKEKFRKVVIKNFIQIIEKSASDIFSSIIIQNSQEQQVWLKQCGFIEKQGSLIYPLKPSQKRQKTRQFLTIYGSIFNVRQRVNETFLYSDEISTFKGGKFDINEKIFYSDQFNLIPSYICKNLTSMKEINQILQLKELDTFEVSTNVQALIFNSSQTPQNHADLRTFTLEQILNKEFIISNGWIKTTSDLIFNEKNQKISLIIIPGNYQMYFGKGFQHIGTMKNKLTHYKTRLNSKKSTDLVSNKYPTKIRMFSKQLYGLIKHQNNIAYYGNWEMNFHFKHQFLGRIAYSIETQSNESRLIFGNSTFFVTIYRGDQFIIGWEVEENDFLY